MKTSVRVGLVVNPTAGGGAGKDAGNRLARMLSEAGVRVVGLSGLTADVALENVRRAREAIDALIVVGGDGMVHLAIQAIAESEIPLGIVPVGTGNDFARSAGIARRADRAMAAVVEHLASDIPARAVDLLRVTGDGVDRDGMTEEGVRWVAGAVSAGLDAAVNARANRMRFPRGTLRYVVAALREIGAYRSWRYRVSMVGASPSPAVHATLRRFPGVVLCGDDSAGPERMTWAQRGALVTAANGATVGGGIRVATSARIDDGALDLVLAQDVGRLTAARLFPLMLVGAHVRSSALRVIAARTVVIESPDGPAVYGDGERLGPTPVRVEVIPAALRLLA